MWSLFSNYTLSSRDRRLLKELSARRKEFIFKEDGTIRLDYSNPVVLSRLFSKLKHDFKDKSWN